MTYRLSPQAEVDIETIGDYIAAHSPAAAIRLIQTFLRRFDQIAVYPQSGIPTEEILPGLRHLVVGRYLAFYRVTDDAVIVLRVLHGRRDITADDLEG